MRGARNLLAGSSPPILLIEVYEPWTRDFEYSPGDLFDFLAEVGGYRFHHLDGKGLRPVLDWRDGVPGSFPDNLNFLCTVPRAHDARLQQVMTEFGEALP